MLAIARNGKLVYFQAFGYRDKAPGAKMTTDTILNIASLTKPMTTVGPLSLVGRPRAERESYRWALIHASWVNT